MCYMYLQVIQINIIIIIDEPYTSFANARNKIVGRT